ncbi:Protein DGCR14 [Hypsibius exemplaris]|uniref:Protein DGCR14 n=1 Tax=Hypsibius exemplaris TaxID=2072580 RepID=A0A1W0WVI8_HYPEX|nr:Protein DGCR14 [Hypsibius exemplaris]
MKFLIPSIFTWFRRQKGLDSRGSRQIWYCKMALVPVKDKALISQEDASFKTPSIPKKRKKVLEEEAYTKDLERIIQRDFFPDVPKLKAQNEYLDAEARNDIGKLRELQMQYRPTPKRPDSSSSQITSASPLTFQSPATFETPASPVTRGAAAKQNAVDPLMKTPVPPPTPMSVSSKIETSSISTSSSKDHLGLDAFLCRVTSEDNASFEDIMEESEKRHRRKYPWLHEEDHSKKFIKAPPVSAITHIAGGVLLALEDVRLNSVDSWDYKARNSVMQNPEGVAFTPDEMTTREQQTIMVRHGNTRFEHDPWKNIEVSGDRSSQMALGKIGPDGLEILPSSTPKVNGYAFMPSPSPAPGVGESPMMTWGEIEGTPFALDASDTPVLSRTPGPQFKIPDVPDRDKIHLELVDNVTKRHRAKREEALKQVRSLASSTPKFGSASSAERLSTMSPAAQRLATKRLGIRLSTDKALAASYSPSPRRSPRTPIGGQPGSSGTATPKTPGSSTPSTPSITDNLLDLRKAYSAGK